MASEDVQRGGYDLEKKMSGQWSTVEVRCKQTTQPRKKICSFLMVINLAVWEDPSMALMFLLYCMMLMKKVTMQNPSCTFCSPVRLLWPLKPSQVNKINKVRYFLWNTIWWTKTLIFSFIILEEPTKYEWITYLKQVRRNGWLLVNYKLLKNFKSTPQKVDLPGYCETAMAPMVGLIRYVYHKRPSPQINDRRDTHLERANASLEKNNNCIILIKM